MYYALLLLLSIHSAPPKCRVDVLYHVLHHNPQDLQVARSLLGGPRSSWILAHKHPSAIVHNPNPITHLTTSRRGFCLLSENYTHELSDRFPLRVIPCCATRVQGTALFNGVIDLYSKTEFLVARANRTSILSKNQTGVAAWRVVCAFKNV
jgi:hypothetical protein